MGIEFLRISFLETKDHLTWNDAFLCTLEFEIGVEGDLSCILVDMCRDFFLVDLVLCNAVLIHSHCCQRIQRPRVDLASSIGDHTDNNLLPPIRAPGPRLFSRTEVGDVPHDPMHRSGEVDLVLVVHGNTDKQFGLAHGAPNVLS